MTALSTSIHGKLNILDKYFILILMVSVDKLLIFLLIELYISLLVLGGDLRTLILSAVRRPRFW